MTAILLALLVGGNAATAPEPAGICTYYNPGVMTRVAEYRGLRDACRECVGMVAVLHCEQLGARVYLAHEGETEGPFLVVDCAEGKHRANLTARGLVAEVDWQTSRRWGMAGPVACRVVTPPVEPLLRRRGGVIE
jgi:hypothetical protein